MKIVYHRAFKKGYKKLSNDAREKTRCAIELFAKNPKHPSLRNHALTGRMKGLRSIRVTSDVRIIFKEREGYLIVIFLDVGGHNEVYR